MPRANATLRAQVLIVGGGPVGVGLAIDLAMRGVSSILIERRVGMHNIPRGQNLTQRTLERDRKSTRLNSSHT